MIRAPRLGGAHDLVTPSSGDPDEAIEDSERLAPGMTCRRRRLSRRSSPIGPPTYAGGFGVRSTYGPPGSGFLLQFRTRRIW